MNENKLGLYIKEYREKHNLTLREFSQKCGLSHTYIDKLQKGVDPRSSKPIFPTIDTLQKVADATDISLRNLLTRLDYIDDNVNGAYEFVEDFVAGMKNKGVDLKGDSLDKILDKILEAAELINKIKEK
ncbi:helix-turn-helix domain-containing protein [Tepidibacter mesophilus]|uniref:helix-turn-helix domain-containing protein n=1 Tax=Tepidibacter mesophilus TaxID=655607 RepID=UPI000C0855EA|nr:helix-turn-helix transcriptional regulator [Tepidibacter mesophilus]